MTIDPAADIVILSQKTPRAEILSEMISEGIGIQVSVKIFDINRLEDIPDANKVQLCLVDLMSTNTKAITSISEIKDALPNARVIALHIYTLPELIRPIVEQGVDGYLSYEPSRTELIKSVNEVLSGGTYLPNDLQ